MTTHQSILITGGAGFVGANLVRYLLEQGGYQITVFDNLSVGSKDNLRQAVTDATLQKGPDPVVVEGDILDAERISEGVRGQDFVIHLAAETQVRESIRNPRNHLQINAQGTLNVLEAARIHRVKGFLFASSNAAAGRQEPPIQEAVVPCPMSPYGAVKLYGEALCMAYYHSFGLPTVIFRFSNVYGPYSLHKTSVVNRFFGRIYDGLPLEIYGDGLQTRDFVHAADIAQGLWLALERGRDDKSLWGQVIQLATATETTIRTVAESIRSLPDEKDCPLVHLDSLPGEILRNVSDISRARKCLGYEPRMKLNEQLPLLWRWYRQQRQTGQTPFSQTGNDSV